MGHSSFTFSLTLITQKHSLSTLSPSLAVELPPPLLTHPLRRNTHSRTHSPRSPSRRRSSPHTRTYTDAEKRGRSLLPFMPIVANCAVAEERLCRRELQPPPLKPPSPSSLSASERESSRKRGTLSRHAPSSLELHRRRRPAAVRGESSPSGSLPEEESLHKGLLEWLAAAARATAPLAAGKSH